MTTETQAQQAWTKKPQDDSLAYADVMGPQTRDGRRMIAHTLRVDDADRIIACVNALAGIPDPPAAIEAAREALEDTLVLVASLPADCFGLELDKRTGEAEFSYRDVLLDRIRHALTLLKEQTP